MATALHNLSEFDPNILPPKEVLARQGYVIVVADWNSEITYSLLKGAVDTLVESGVKANNIEVVHVPGAVELTYVAAKYVNLSAMHAANDLAHHHFACDTLTECKHIDGIIVIGCVIQGDTPHFDYVCQSVTDGVTRLNAQGIVPIVFSVLTTLDKQQALDRAGGKLGNKGVEGAYTAMRMASISQTSNRYTAAEE